MRRDRKIYRGTGGPFDDSAQFRLQRMGLLDGDGVPDQDALTVMAVVFSGLLFDDFCDFFQSYDEVEAAVCRLMENAEGADAKHRFLLICLQYWSATGADADQLWKDAVAKTGLGEMDAITRENVKWMMSFIADYTGEIPGSLHMALQTYIWDNQSDKSAGGDPSGDIDAGGFANADTHDTYVGYYNWMLGQKANEDAALQAQVEAYAQQGIQASIVEDDSTKWAVLAISSVSGRQSFFNYHVDRKVVTDDEPLPDDNPPPVAGDGDIVFRKVKAGTTRGLDGAV